MGYLQHLDCCALCKTFFGFTHYCLDQEAKWILHLVALMGLSLQILMSCTYNDWWKNKLVWKQKGDMSIRTIYFKSYIPKIIAETTMRKNLWARSVSELPCPSVCGCFTHLTEAQNLMVISGSVESKFSGEQGYCQVWHQIYLWITFQCNLSELPNDEESGW